MVAYDRKGKLCDNKKTEKQPSIIRKKHQNQKSDFETIKQIEKKPEIIKFSRKLKCAIL